MAQIFEAGNCISVVGQDCVIGREPEGGDPKDSFPIFGNGLIPHMAASAGANAGTQVGGVGLDGEVLPIRNVLLKPIFGLRGEVIEVNKVSGDDNAFGSIEFKIGKRSRVIKNGFDKFLKVCSCQ